MSVRAGSASSTLAVLPVCVAGYLVPGLGHVLLGKVWRGLLLFIVVVTLFALGTRLEGELFPLDPGRPLTLLAGLAEMGAGAPYFAARLMNLGAGRVESPTYEYGYTFIVVAGLINLLVILDAYDIALGRKQ